MWGGRPPTVCLPPARHATSLREHTNGPRAFGLRRWQMGLRLRQAVQRAAERGLALGTAAGAFTLPLPSRGGTEGTSRPAPNVMCTRARASAASRCRQSLVCASSRSGPPRLTRCRSPRRHFAPRTRRLHACSVSSRQPRAEPPPPPSLYPRQAPQMRTRSASSRSRAASRASAAYGHSHGACEGRLGC